MCRKQRPTLRQVFWRLRGAVVISASIALLLGGVLAAGAVSTDKKSKSSTTDAGYATSSSFADYVPYGYSIEGPLTIVFVSAKAINFFSGRSAKPLVLDLQGTQLSVRDANNKVLSLDALTSGVRVYVCRSADKKTIIIFVVPLTGEGKSDV